MQSDVVTDLGLQVANPQQTVVLSEDIPIGTEVRCLQTVPPGRRPPLLTHHPHLPAIMPIIRSSRNPRLYRNHPLSARYNLIQKESQKKCTTLYRSGAYRPAHDSPAHGPSTGVATAPGLVLVSITTSALGRSIAPSLVQYRSPICM